LRGFIVLGALIALVIAATLLRSPRLDRDWGDDVAVLASVSFAPAAERFTIRNARDWRYTTTGPEQRAAFDATYEFADLVGMAFYEQVFDRSGLIAHTFVVFEFAGDPAQPLPGVSV
jgi:hypothetical protein